MRILISGICGFVGSALARGIAAQAKGTEIHGIDSLARPGSETNRPVLEALGVRVAVGDIRSEQDVDSMPACDWVIDAAANPSVLAGVDGRSTPREAIEHNLYGTVNILEYCRRHRAGLILLSSSRVYSINRLSDVPVVASGRAFGLQGGGFPDGAGPLGISENFSTASPISLYGATKLSSEALALEYGEAFGFPVFINRCGVLAGAGQFGRPDQGIVSYWINSHLRRRPLRYLGFGGKGLQVRDCLHPLDLMPLLEAQMAARGVSAEDRVVNVGGGLESAFSLLQLSDWCDARFGAHEIEPDLSARRYDIPWLVLDSSKATRVWGWRPSTPLASVLDEVAAHAAAHPGWLELSAPKR